jgi:hypothetical protein
MRWPGGKEGNRYEERDGVKPEPELQVLIFDLHDLDSRPPNSKSGAWEDQEVLAADRGHGGQRREIQREGAAH